MQHQQLSSSAYDMWTLYTFQSICQQCCVHNVVLYVQCMSRLEVKMSPQMKEGWRLRLGIQGRTTSIEQTWKPSELVLSPDTWLQVTSCDPVTSCTNIAGRNNEWASLLYVYIFAGEHNEDHQTVHVTLLFYPVTWHLNNRQYTDGMGSSPFYLKSYYCHVSVLSNL